MSRQDLLCVLFQKSFCYSYVLIWRQSFVFSSGKVWRGQSIHDLAQSKKLSSETFSQMTLKTLTRRKESLVVISTLNYQIEFFLIIQSDCVVVRGIDNQINQKNLGYYSGISITILNTLGIDKHSTPVYTVVSNQSGKKNFFFIQKFNA